MHNTLDDQKETIEIVTVISIWCVLQLFAVLFFLMLFTLGVGSAAGLTGNIITVIGDQFPKVKKVYITLAICISGFLLGLVYVTPVRTSAHFCHSHLPLVLARK